MTMNSDEEARGAAYRAQGARRYANMRARAIGLSGDMGAALALRGRWDALHQFLLERRYQGVPGRPGGLENWPDRPHAIGPHRGEHADG